MPESIERGMFYGAKPDIFKKASQLRNNLTVCEKMIWDRLSKNKIMGFRFKCQHPIDIFIVDFYCHKLKLVIEIDGGIHQKPQQAEYDLGREAEMAFYDIETVRFTNDEIIQDINAVVRKIVQICNDRQIEIAPNP